MYQPANHYQINRLQVLVSGTKSVWKPVPHQQHALATSCIGRGRVRYQRYDTQGAMATCGHIAAPKQGINLQKCHTLI